MTRRHKNNTADFKAQRLKVLRRDGHTCYYCGEGGATHVDHIVPMASGGGDEMDNLVAACARCNQRKGSKSLQAFLGQRSAPLVFSEGFYPKTTVTPQPGPCLGQPTQDLKQ